MGNTPSQQAGAAAASGQPTSAQPQTTAAAANVSTGGPQRLPQRHRTSSPSGHISPPVLGPPGSSPSYTSLRPGSPRRRKSLELPDLNSRLSLTSAHPTPAVSGTPAPTDDASSRPPTTVSTAAGGPSESSSSRRMASPVASTPPAPPSAMPIPGARPVRRWGSSRDRSSNKGKSADEQKTVAPPPIRTQHNPYFPAVEQIPEPGRAAAATSNNAIPVTPGLPHYSVSPHATVYHTEDVDAPGADRQDRLSVQPSVSGRQPSPARPAPAIVTKAPQYHDHQSTPQQSALPPSAASASDSQQQQQQQQQNIPTVQLPAISPTVRPDHEVIVSHLPEGNTPQEEVPEELRASSAAISTPIDAQARAEAANKARNAGASGQLLQQGVAQKDGQGTVNGMVPTLVTWNGGGRDVYVTGTFAEHGWKTRLKLEKSTHDFSLLLNLPPGTHRVKFIVDGQWRCSNDLQTATDGDGNLVNWLEVEVPRTGGDPDEDWAVAEWAKKAYNAEVDEDDPSIWTNEIPPALIHFQELEERGIATPPDELPPKELHAYRDHQKQLLSMLPLPPTLPRHLEKVILNTTPKELEGTVGGRGGDDNSILPVPNHVVLNHLTASAIKNGTLAVGTTTRYRRKYISTIYFKPVGDL